MQSIPFFRPSIRQPEIDEVIATLKSGWLTTGERVKRFESQFAEYVNVKHAIAVNSCTAALHLSLEALGVGPGDGVLVPTMTFAATAEVVAYVGAVPILVDCHADDLNLDVEDARKRAEVAKGRGVNIRAIIPVHYGGQPCDVPEIGKLADELNLAVIDDAAHCCPAFYRTSDGMPWLPVGTGSDASCYSFYANKTITTGEGGMVTTNDDALAHRMRLMSLHGISHDAWKRYSAEGSWYYEIIAPGFKYNLTDIAAAIGIHQLERANEMRARRAQIAELYIARLQQFAGVRILKVGSNRLHSWHLCVVRVPKEKRDSVISFLKQRGIGTSVHWMPLHMHPHYRNTYGYKEHDYPVAEAAFREIISLPIFPDLPDSDVERVCSELSEALGRE